MIFMLLANIIPVTLSADPCPMPSLKDVRYITRTFAKAGGSCLPESILMIQFWKAKTGQKGYVLFARNDKNAHAMAILLNDTEAVFYDPNGKFIVRVRAFDLEDPLKSILATPVIAKILKNRHYDNENLFLSKEDSECMQASDGVVMRVGDAYWRYNGIGSRSMNSVLVASK